ncbi:Cro/CI family transcriptional regulator [Pseudomonas sp. MH2]|uniref:Cro/CI family transcriptional regulator n=1 Tax=Pseudomonas machongensis TaxID=3110229 RepID=A0ABU5VCE7_9PSED|nr:Cro/CI family transcriptional regulator [Pseudomonas sp. MH2]MEA5670463.1 Cro/CI family transcriptional regulator [Pseudomonas sp. MH2]
MASSIKELIKHFGTQAQTATAMGVSQATVSYWLSGALSISAEKALLAETATEGAVSAASLCHLIAQVEARYKVGESSAKTSPVAPGPVGSVCTSSITKEAV